MGTCLRAFLTHKFLVRRGGKNKKKEKGKEITINSLLLHGEARSSSPIRFGLPGNISNYLPSDQVSHFRLLKS